VKAALEEGVVVGGGITYWKLSKDLDPSLLTLSPGEKAGFNLV
jgi:chaperonin GroEL (HSP60 family)